MVEFNFEKGSISSLRITINDEEDRLAQRKIKPKIEVKKGDWFLNKYMPNNRQ